MLEIVQHDDNVKIIRYDQTIKFINKGLESDITMPTIIPQGTALKKAVSWISENLKSGNETAIDTLINEAVFRFDLTPKDSDFLYHFYAELRAEEKNNMNDKMS